LKKKRVRRSGKNRAFAEGNIEELGGPFAGFLERVLIWGKTMVITSGGGNQKINLKIHLKGRKGLLLIKH